MTIRPGLIDDRLGRGFLLVVVLLLVLVLVLVARSKVERTSIDVWPHITLDPRARTGGRRVKGGGQRKTDGKTLECRLLV